MRNPVKNIHNQRASMRCEYRRWADSHPLIENLEVTELDELKQALPDKWAGQERRSTEVKIPW